MAILHADNFSIYGYNKAFLLNGLYAENGGDLFIVNDPDGVSDGRVIRHDAASILRYVLPTFKTTVGVAQRVWFDALPNSGTANVNGILALFNGSNGIILCLSVDPTGRIRAWSGIPGSATLLGTTDIPAITANGWYHIETKIVQAGASSSIEVRVEGIVVLDLDNVAFGTSEPFASVGWRNQGSPATTSWSLKDVVVWDTAGSFNTDFLGSVLVASLMPDSDVVNNWTPSTGTSGAAILDNIPPNESEYISAAANIGQVVALQDLPADVTSVRALISFVRAAKIDGGDGSIRNAILTTVGGTAVANGIIRPITVAQTYWTDVYEIDPNTSAPWLPAAVNGARLRLGRTT